MSERSLQEFVHDFRNPLSVMQITTEALLEKADDEETRTGLETILRQVERLTHLAAEISRARA